MGNDANSRLHLINALAPHRRESPPMPLTREYVASNRRVRTTARRLVHAIDRWTLDVTNPNRHYNTRDRNAQR